jgi:hypothetical protein
MGSNTGFEPDRRELWDDPTPLGRTPEGTTYRLTKRAALTVVILLSIGLWAAIWTAIASLASAALS